MDLNSAGTNFKTVVDYISDIIAILVPILVGIAFIVFFWGLSKFILNSGKPEEIKNGRTYMLWGILALFVLMTFRVIIPLIRNELEIGRESPLLRTNVR